MSEGLGASRKACPKDSSRWRSRVTLASRLVRRDRDRRSGHSRGLSHRDRIDLEVLPTLQAVGKHVEVELRISIDGVHLKLDVLPGPIRKAKRGAG